MRTIARSLIFFPGLTRWAKILRPSGAESGLCAGPCSQGLRPGLNSCAPAGLNEGHRSVLGLFPRAYAVGLNSRAPEGLNTESISLSVSHEINDAIRVPCRAPPGSSLRRYY